MRKKRSKRMISVLLAAVMTLGMAACGGSGTNSDQAANNEAAKQYVYRMEQVGENLVGENSSVYSAGYADGRIYLLTSEYRWDEMTGMTAGLLSVNEDGSDVQSVELINTLRENPDYMEDGIDEDMGVMPLDGARTGEVQTEDTQTEDSQTAENGAQIYNDTYINSAYIDESGLYMVLESSSYYYDDMGNYISDGYALTLCGYSLTGEERFREVLNDSQDNYMYINAITGDGDGNIALINDSMVLLYDSEGAPVTQIDTSGQGGYIQTAVIKEDRIYLIAYNEDWTKLLARPYNLQTGASEADVELPGNLTSYSFTAGKNYDLLLTGNTGVSGYNIGDAEPIQILSYINSDIDSNNVNRIFEADENRLMCIYTEDYTAQYLAILTYVDPADIPDKEVISLACYYLDYNMRKRIVEYNKTNEQYRITVEDYSTYATMEDYSSGFTQLNNDILAGKVPDILVLNETYMPVSSYIAQGILADIGEMIDEDPELDREDFMTNVFDAYSVDGRLYSVIPNFYVSTVMGKTADVGDTPGWTMDDLKALMAKYPDASAFGESMTRDSILWSMMMYSGSRFVDRDSGECHFDTQEFIDMLEFAAQFPETYDWENADDSFWNDYETQYRSGRTLLMQMTLSDFGDYGYYSQGYFGEDVTLIGFPAQEGIGAVVNAANQLGISASSANKEGAWEFVRYYLTEEYQTSSEMSYSLPVRKDALLAKLEEAKERPYWENEDGTREYYDRTYYIGDQEIIINPLTDEEAQELYDYISSVNMAYYYDESLGNIITEESAAYFAGQKSVEEVVDIIQSRAQIYINESR